MDHQQSESQGNPAESPASPPPGFGNDAPAPVGLPPSGPPPPRQTQSFSIPAQLPRGSATGESSSAGGVSGNGSLPPGASHPGVRAEPSGSIAQSTPTLSTSNPPAPPSAEVRQVASQFPARMPEVADRWRQQILLSFPPGSEESLRRAAGAVGAQLVPGLSREDMAAAVVAAGRARDLISFVVEGDAATESYRSQWADWFIKAGDQQSLVMTAALLRLPVLASASVREIAYALAAPEARDRARAALEQELSRRRPPPPWSSPSPRDRNARRGPNADDPYDPSLVETIVTRLSFQDLLEAHTEFLGEPSGPMTAKELATALALMGWGPATLEQAEAAEEGEVPAFSRGAPASRTLTGELPSVSSGARGGPAVKGDATSTLSLATPRASTVPTTTSSVPPVPVSSDAAFPTIETLIQRVQDLERQQSSDQLLRRVLEAQLSGDLRDQLLADQAIKPSQPKLEHLTSLAKASQGAVADLGLAVPTFGPSMEPLLLNSPAARYTAHELSWALQRELDLIALQHQAWVTLNLIGDVVPLQYRTMLRPFIEKMQQVWAMSHGHYHATVERMRALCRGVLTKQWEELPPIPRQAGVLPRPLATAEELSKWKKHSTSITPSTSTAGNKRELHSAASGSQQPKKFQKSAAFKKHPIAPAP